MLVPLTPRLVPLLTRADISSLSASCKSQLKALSTGPVTALAVHHSREGPNPRKSAAPLLSLLARHKKAVTKLRVADPRIYTHVLTAVRAGHCVRLLTLSLARLGLSDEHTSTLAQVLAEDGLLPSLECLVLTGNLFSEAGVRVLARALAECACPSLKELRLSPNGFGQHGTGLTALAEALEIRGGPKAKTPCAGLTVLELGTWGWHRPVYPPLVKRLLSAPILGKTLEELRLGQVSLSTAELAAVAFYMRTSGSPLLRVLSLRGFDEEPGGKGLMAIIEALSEGAAPALHTLELLNVRTTDAALTSLGVAMRSHSALSQLHTLRMSSAGLGSGELNVLLHCLCVASPTRSAALRALLLDDNPKVGNVGVLALATYIRDGGLSGLEWLHLGGCKATDKGVMELCRTLQQHRDRGASASLKRLELDECALGPNAVRALCTALTYGACRSLEALSLAGNEGIGDEGLMVLAEALMSGRAAQLLKSLDLRWVGMGQQGADALTRAFEAGACERLETLKLMQNPQEWNMDMRAAMQRMKQALNKPATEQPKKPWRRRLSRVHVWYV